MTATAKLMAAMGVDTSQFNSGLDAAQKKTDSFNAVLSKVGGALAGVFAASKILDFAKGIVSGLSDISDAADDLGVTTDALQALQWAAADTSVDFSKVTTALAKLKNAQSDVADNPKLQGAFKTLGMDLSKIQMMRTEDLFASIGKALAGASDQQAAFNAICEIFGDKIGPRLVALLKSVAGEGLGAFTDSVRAAGGIVDEETIRMADSFDRFFKRLIIRIKAHIVSAKGLYADSPALLGMGQGMSMDDYTGMMNELEGGNDKTTQSAPTGTAKPIVDKAAESKADRMAALKKAAADAERKVALDEADRQGKIEILVKQRSQIWRDMDKARYKDEEEFLKLKAEEADVERQINALHREGVKAVTEKNEKEAKAKVDRKNDEFNRMAAQVDREIEGGKQRDKVEKDAKKRIAALAGMDAPSLRADAYQRMGGIIGATASPQQRAAEKALRVAEETKRIQTEMNEALQDIRAGMAGG